MKRQPHRLTATGEHHLAGTAIDRSVPLQFKLDGRTIQGFAGDTVLSAALANGIDTVGRRHGSPMGLVHRFAPVIAFAALASDHQRALPMERTPVTEGPEYVTVTGSSRSIAARVRGLLRPSRSLDIDLDRPEAMQQPWIPTLGEAGPASDLVVIGGGVAGMSAALAGAKAGLSVILLEASPRLGGHARLFGSLEGEEAPDLAISRLSAAITASDAITVVTSAEAFAVRPGAVRAHLVERIEGIPTGRVVDYAAPRIVIATGAIERLPIFPGNRLPGIAGALEAFDLAYHYGVWPGRSALFATASSPAYRLAMLAHDAGVAVPRVIDSRPHPQSRFVEFSRAYGITQAPATLIASAHPAPRGGGLVARPRLSMEGFSRAEPEIMADRLIACGGWQPDLTLWHMANGESRWDAASHRLIPGPGPDGVMLAGSAAGYLSNRACRQSGADAIDALLGRPRNEVAELAVDPIYETPDAAVPLGPEGDAEAAPAFLDAGHRTIERPRSAVSRWPAWLPFVPRPPGWSLADTPQPLDIGDIAAGVQLGAIPAASAGIVAQERVAMVAIAEPESVAGGTATSLPLPLFPAFLVGRFGGRGQLWLVAPSEERSLEPGALIQPDADSTDPLGAIGVVVRPLKGAAVALFDTTRVTAGQRASVRDHGRAIPVRLVVVYREGMDLAAALGGRAGTP